MEPLSAVGARIRTLRKRRGLTQQELAGRIGRSAEALSVLERGRSTPTLPVLGRLAGALEVPLRDFFAPAGAAGEVAQNPKQAALFAELIDSARALPPAGLEMTVRIVAVLADYFRADSHGKGKSGPDRAAGRDQGAGAAVSERPPEWVRETLDALLHLYGRDRQAITAMLTRRREFLRGRGDEKDVDFLDTLLKRLWQR